MEQIGRTKVTYTRRLIVWMSEKTKWRRERAQGALASILHYQKLTGNFLEDEKNWRHGSRGQQKVVS